MGYYYKAYNKDPKAKRVFKILGPILLVPGVVLLVLGILGFVGVLSLSAGIVCIDCGSMAFIMGLVFTIVGWHPKVSVYSNRSNHFEEIPDTPTVKTSVVVGTVENKTVNCVNCGAVNDSDNSFCKKCGKPLALSLICPNCNAKVDSDSKYCPKCGHAIFDKEKELHSESENTESDKTKESSTESENSEFDKAKELYNRGEYNEAVKLFRILAERGDAGGQNGLGACYNNGQGVPQNPYEAVKWFRKSADQGYAKAYYNLGVSYAKGEGVQQNKIEAVKWFKKADAFGIFEARNALRMLGYKGQDEAFENLNNALDNMHQALSQLKKIEIDPVPQEKSQPQQTEQIDAEAEYDLGYRYFNGIGVEMNKEEAFKCYLRAAEQGHKGAMNKVGDCYYFGHGVEKNTLEATYWYRKANAAK